MLFKEYFELVYKSGVFVGKIRQKIAQDDFDLEVALRRIGKRCFVDYFICFSDTAVTNSDLIEKIIDPSAVSESSAKTKASTGKKIFSLGLQYEALRNIVSSDKVDVGTRKRAAELLNYREGIRLSKAVKLDQGLATDKASLSVWSEKVCYSRLNARQKENYNFQKISSSLADIGFSTIRLSDDWMGADFLAAHIDGVTFLRVQLKGRLTIDKKYLGKGLHIAFRDENQWYLYPHDLVCDCILKLGTVKDSDSWANEGNYHWPKIPKVLMDLLVQYQLSDSSFGN